MGIDLRQFNPLEYFKEFGLFSKVAFLIGFFLFGIGLLQQVSPRNPTIFVGLALMLFALSCHYVRSSFWRDRLDPDHKLQCRPNWLMGLSRGLFCATSALISLLWSLHIYLGDREPYWVRAFWVKVVKIIW